MDGAQSKFVNQFNATMGRNNIFSFKQHWTELLHEALQRYKRLLGDCPYHDFPLWMQVEYFYKGLNLPTRRSIDFDAGGSLHNMTPEAAIDLIEDMAMSSYHSQCNEAWSGKPSGVHYDNLPPLFATQVEPFQESFGGDQWIHEQLPRSAQQPPPQVEKSELEEILTKYSLESETREKEKEASSKECSKDTWDLNACIERIENYVDQIIKSIAEEQQEPPINPTPNSNEVAMEELETMEVAREEIQEQAMLEVAKKQGDEMEPKEEKKEEIEAAEVRQQEELEKKAANTPST